MVSGHYTICGETTTSLHFIREHLNSATQLHTLHKSHRQEFGLCSILPVTFLLL